MLDKLFFLAGLPRSGTTLIGLILDQNPNIYSHMSSAFCEILWRNYSIWHDDNYAEDFTDENLKSSKKKFLKNIATSYFSNLTNKKYILDRRRNWNGIANIEMLKDIFNKKPKILCPIRPIEEIVASWKKIFLFNKKEWNDSCLNGNLFYASYNALKQACENGYKEYFHFIEYDNFIKNPQKELKKIYSFLEIDFYSHDLLNIKNKIYLEKVNSLFLNGIYNISSNILKSDTNPDKILTEKEYEKYSSMNFWK